MSDRRTTAFYIRPATRDDVDSLRHIYRRSSLSNESDRADLLAHPDALEWSASSVEEGRTFVAAERKEIDEREEGSRVMGFATIFESSGFVELEDLFVDPEDMRRGIGTSLVHEVVTLARRRGFERIEVTANWHALAFYESAGFVVEGETETRFGTAPRMHRAV